MKDKDKRLVELLFASRLTKKKRERWCVAFEKHFPGTSMKKRATRYWLLIPTTTGGALTAIWNFMLLKDFTDIKVIPPSN